MSFSSTTIPPFARAGWLALSPIVCGLVFAYTSEAFAAETEGSDSKPSQTASVPATNAPDLKAVESSSALKNGEANSATNGVPNLATTNAPSASDTNGVSSKANASANSDDGSSSRREDRGRDRRRRDRSSGSSDSSTTPANKGTDFASFKIITDRNIFSPSRTTPSSSRSEAPRQPKVDSFSLVGTMSYDKGDFAFFDGSGSEYRKVLKATDSIAGYKVLSVADNEVVLESGEKKFTLKMGGQFRRVDDGPWEQKAGSSASSEASTKSSSSASIETSGGSGGAEDEILQRLLKKREQELNNEKR